LQKIILKWLDNKINYIGLKPQKDSNLKFQSKFTQLIIYSRVNKKYLKPTPCYLIVNGENTKYNKITRNSTFENFNLKINEYAITITSICFLLKVLFKKDTHKVIVNSTISSILDEVKQYFSIKNNYILDKEDKLDIFKTFFNKYSPDNINFEDIRDNKLVLDEFKQDLENLSKLGCNRLNKIGIFYPFKYDIDIFGDNFYLLDINFFRFHNKKLDSYHMVDAFYKQAINADIETIMTLDQYFKLPFSLEHYAYFDPFQYEKVHAENHKKLLEYVTLKGFNQDEFTIEFFNFLNSLQFTTINNQYINLLNMIGTYHYTNKTTDKSYTLKETVWNMLIKSSNYFDANYINILLKIYNALDKKNIRKKRVNADDLGFKYDDEKTKILVNDTLNFLYNVLGRDSSLMHFYNICENEFKTRFKKYKFNEDSQKIIKQIMKDLILQYNEMSEENMKTKRINPFLYKIYNKYKKKGLEDTIDFNHQANFIQRYSKQFNRQIPYLDKDGWNIKTYGLTCEKFCN